MVSGSSPTLWEQDLARIREKCLAGMEAGNSQFELIIIPTTGLTEDSLPIGFAAAVRKFCELSATVPIFPQRLYLLPYFRAAKPNHMGKSKLPQFAGILDVSRLELVRNYRVKAVVENQTEDFVTALRSLSRRDNEGELLPGEVKYLEFMRFAGGLLRHHKIIIKVDDEHAWMSFLVGYLWNHNRPEISHLFATVGNLWGHSLAAIDRLMNGEPEQPQRSRGRRKTLRPSDEEIFDRWISEHHLSKISRKEFAKSVGMSYVALARLLNTVRQSRRRGR